MEGRASDGGVMQRQRTLVDISIPTALLAYVVVEFSMRGMISLLTEGCRLDETDSSDPSSRDRCSLAAVRFDAELVLVDTSGVRKERKKKGPKKKKTFGK